MTGKGTVGKATEKKKMSTRGKAWGDDEVQLLISAWKAASLQEMPVGSASKMLGQVIYHNYLASLAKMRAVTTGTSPLAPEDFKAICANDGAEGDLDVSSESFRPRSLRSTEDKTASLKQSFTLISDHNNGSLLGSTGHPAWFEMSKEERVSVLKKWKRVALSETCFTLLMGIFEDDPSVAPIAGGVTSGSHKRATDGSCQGGSAKKKAKINDLAEIMQGIMDGAVESMRVIASEDRENFIQHQKKENEKNRELLRSLFGRDWY
ncbi:hypothetical protein PF005_g21441 [Phytophthora fragariae]|uniref:Uncharacterized protein n=1 Tax=Phytophthora fragariae TaxID=53985 RepID=A0A6A3X689_9STRA|nr:hypothetical protein PF009_g22475 [Phytophthora fragariae]KAE8985756.1 hypothetical protein PF011_g20258 [Phytophthora fragariae]KAE9080944.1 hypothetical protein PF007_g22841 [Phytophthora fragariae]KAE9109977.1 hypothetical protein PF006_g20546 [Phytophthora fragariae]KAE9176808.1 hypothetical protein PF004_g25957 [Phytophthora fragariae]